jgi:SAM-dependent methyltransferase
VTLEAFVLQHMPTPRSRVLEVGCGRGQLAQALAAAGHRVVAIDPEAPEGAIFRRVTLEEFSDEESFDAVVASRSLHHVHDLARGLDRLAELLRPAGILVVNEHAFDRLDERTARWHLSHAADPAVPGSPESFLRWWNDTHEGLHGYETMRAELDQSFEQRFFAWGPYLYEELERVEPAEEMRLIEAGEIQATGFRFVGELRPSSPGARHS